MRVATNHYIGISYDGSHGFAQCSQNEGLSRSHLLPWAKCHSLESLKHAIRDGGIDSQHKTWFQSAPQTGNTIVGKNGLEGLHERELLDGRLLACRDNRHWNGEEL